jgi:hypothetical protein
MVSRGGIRIGLESMINLALIALPSQSRFSVSVGTVDFSLFSYTFLRP